MANNHPVKCLSFDSRFQDDNKSKDEKDIGKSYSFAARVSSDLNNDSNNDHKLRQPVTIHEVDEELENDQQHEAVAEEEEKEFTLDQLSEDIDQFILSLSSSSNDDNDDPPEISKEVAMFVKKVEAKIEEYESTAQDSIVFGRDVEGDSSFVAAVNRLSGLMEAIHGLKSGYMMPLLNQTSSVLHRVMVFLEEELRLILEEPVCQNSNNAADCSNSKHTDSSLKSLKGRLQSFASSAHPHDHHQDEGSGEGADSCELQEGGDPESEEQQEGKETTITFPYFSSDSVSSIRLIANAMIIAGYETECCNVFLIARRHAFEEELKKQGLDKISTDDVQKMNWEPLEGEISTWICVFKHCTSTLLLGEQTFYESVFPDRVRTSQFLYNDISYAILYILVNFAEAVALTKRATEKLFKFLDMYETLRDTVPWVETKTPMYSSEESMKELKSELWFAKSRLGEAAVSIFCQFENSIKGDNTKTPVASGAVHPLTRYTMNYLKYACEYKDTLEQVFQQHLRTEQTEEFSAIDHSSSSDQQRKLVDQQQQQHQQEEKHSPFASQLITIMDLLDSYLESKSKLYKDLSLRYIFLMNNGRYMLQKVKGSTEIHQVVGDNWCRRRSSDVRHYHKSYQRETWSRVLQCLNQEGLQVNGKIHKPILKERFKNFNQLFDEIHRTQSTWVVSDEQLQSELRVSISAVMIPAYRSFVARFGQIFTPGRQVEKYIKFQPDDIETIIEELFDGNPSSIARRKI
ncbi:exocyst complex component EXO70B1-like [Chenopodium quinoa]|uniref:exocyst complex component EXO70B1-like n=1 Tax=Chenopodium quinoa TaxID=63459 RepID=UPI000B774321|nr:exocyst complex component EXO70B1-like [Chenopodium quinoa]